MNAHIITEIAANLRWLEFPAKEAIAKLDHIYFSFKSNNSPCNLELTTELVNQFVFVLYDVRDIKRSRLNTLQKLEVAETILTYLSFRKSDEDRVALFNIIFYRTNFYNGDVPLLVLSLVTSLAIASKNSDVLKCIAMWMLTAGVDSPAVLYVASDVTKDLISDENPEKYSHLPKTDSLFTAVILIAIGKTFRTPPARLIKQVTNWIESCPAVCFVPPHSAIFEIFRWCMNSEEDQSRLNLALLSSIERARKGAQLQVIPHVMTLIQEIRMRKDHSVSNHGNGKEQSVDRLFQLIQMLVAAECLDRNEIHPIFEATEEALLPSTPFYTIMKGIYVK